MERAKRKTQTGFVVSNKMDKTAVIAVERTYIHSFYKKVMKKTSKFSAHDEKNECQIGDAVEISETRPLSKTKKWRVERIIR